MTLRLLMRTGPALAALLVNAAYAAAETPRFALSGSASLSPNATTHSDGKLSLRGYLRADDAPSSAAIVQEGGRFVIMARAVAATQACYNDTIFRDDFDGDGG